MTSRAGEGPEDARSQVLDPEIESLVRESFDRQGLMRHLGAVLVDVRAGEVGIRLPFRPELTQQHGFFHAGGRTLVGAGDIKTITGGHSKSGLCGG